MAERCPQGWRLQAAWHGLSQRTAGQPRERQDWGAVEAAGKAYRRHLHECPQCLAYLRELNAHSRWAAQRESEKREESHEQAHVFDQA